MSSRSAQPGQTGQAAQNAASGGRRLPRPADDGSAGALWTLLSVFLLLLAMFAYLNSRASSDVARAGPVLGSLQKVFQGKGGNPVAGKSRAMMPDALPGEPAYAPVSAAFAEELRLRLTAEGVGAGLSAAGGFSSLRLPVGDFFAARMGALRPEKDHMIDVLAAALKTAGQAGIHRVRIAVPAAPQERLGARRAMALARAFQSRGVPASRLVADVSSGVGDDVVLTFFTQQRGTRGGGE